MQRAKHADRRKTTRRRLELGEAVENAGAGHLSTDEITRVLSEHVGSEVPISHRDEENSDRHSRLLS